MSGNPLINPHTSKSRRRSALVCLLLLGLVWFWGLGHRPLFNTDEGRYAEIPREMLVTGNWVTPRLDGLRYFEKPPLQYWATAAAYAVFGVHDWTARLWTALSSYLTILLTAFAAFKLYGSRAGWLAGAVLAGSFYFGFLGHFNTLDASLAFAMSLTLFGYVLGQRAPPGSRAELGWMLVAYGGAALAVLTKGLIGILLPGAVLVLYILLRRDWGRLRRLRPISGLGVFFLLTLPWFVAVSVQNHDFLWQFFMVQQFLRFLTPISHRPGPWWYFLPLLILAVLPWLYSAVRSLVDGASRVVERDGRFSPDAFLWLWVVFIVFFFSISHSKLPSYVLPVTPALAVLTGITLDRVLTTRWQWAAWGLSLLAGVFGLLVGALGSRLFHHVDPAMLQAYTPWFMAAGGLIVAFTIAAIFLRRKGYLVAVVTVAASWVIATRLVMIGGAAFGPEYSTRGLVHAVAAYNRPGVPVYSVGGYQQTLPFYLRRTMILVAYQGELAFGIDHARSSLEGRYMSSLQDFAAAWRAHSQGLAFVPRPVLPKVKALGIHYRIVAENPRWVALVPETAS
ncbi:MAG TPA: glycosyltransferase family 39 protein [Gammaproteobacteria bacterium]|nr:glycosyltransferase family 39 protein [Gammaproteobacteria bacterium]